MNKKLPQVSYKELLLWALGQRQRFCVEGESMEPLLKKGDLVFIKKTDRLSRGDIGVFEHPLKKGLKIVKKISRIKRGQYELVGTNLEKSTDSRLFGLVSQTNMIGKVTAKL